MITAVSPQPGRLLHLSALRFTGPDSVSFLQGQLSNDVRRLEESRSVLAAFSSPQGRVLALMHLMAHDGGIVAILPRELVAPTVEALRKYVLRSKVRIEDAGESLSIAGALGAPPPDGIGFYAVNGDPRRFWAIGAAENLREHDLAGDLRHTDHFQQEWRLADIRAGLPQIYLPTREVFVAQMLNLDLLGGISFSKGCYTGQEIIARTQHLGRIKRRLYRLRLPPGEWRIGQPLRLADGRTGRLTEVVRSGAEFEALAVLNVGAGSADGSSGTDESKADGPIAAAVLPLPYELC